MSRLIKASLNDDFENILNFIKNQDTFDEVFYDDDDNEYNCISTSSVETEFYFISNETEEDAAVIINNDNINSVEDIEQIFNNLKSETEGLVKEGYIGDIQTDDEVLANIYYDIMDAIDAGSDRFSASEECDEWSYFIKQKGDIIEIKVENMDEQTYTNKTYTVDDFIDWSVRDFIEEVQELCYYTF